MYLIVNVVVVVYHIHILPHHRKMWLVLLSLFLPFSFDNSAHACAYDSGNVISAIVSLSSSTTLVPLKDNSHCDNNHNNHYDVHIRLLLLWWSFSFCVSGTVLHHNIHKRSDNAVWLALPLSSSVPML